jgi:aspartate racemase
MVAANWASKNETLAKPMNLTPPWAPLEYHVLFGVVGGLGPMASVEFARLAVDSRVNLFRAMALGTSPASRTRNVNALLGADEWTEQEVEYVWRQTASRTQLLDQDHIPLLIAQATTVPPRPAFILGLAKVDPTPALTNVAQGLVAAGATHLAVICNTAHYFWDQVQAELAGRAEFVDMLQLALRRAVCLLPRDAPRLLGLLATEATLQTGIYQRTAGALGVDIASPLSLPDGALRQQLVHNVIFGECGIKTGFDTPQTNAQGLKVLLEQCLALQAQTGASVIVLGCTELPLLLTPASVEKWAPVLLAADQAERAKRLRFVDPNRLVVVVVGRWGGLTAAACLWTTSCALLYCPGVDACPAAACVPQLWPQDVRCVCIRVCINQFAAWHRWPDRLGHVRATEQKVCVRHARPPVPVSAELAAAAVVSTTTNTPRPVALARTPVTLPAHRSFRCEPARARPSAAQIPRTPPPRRAPGVLPPMHRIPHAHDELVVTARPASSSMSSPLMTRPDAVSPDTPSQMKRKKELEEENSKAILRIVSSHKESVNSAADDDRCLICMTGFSPKQPVNRIPCSKNCNETPVHEKCIYEWKERETGTGSCPLCRAPLMEMRCVVAPRGPD